MQNSSDKFLKQENLTYPEWKAQMDELNRQLDELWKEIMADPYIKSCLDIDE